MKKIKMNIEMKLPDKLLSEIGSEKPLFIICSSGLNNIMFIFAVIFGISFIIYGYLINPKIIETIFVGGIIAYIFYTYYKKFKNEIYYVGVKDAILVYKNNKIVHNNRSEFSGNMEIISNTELSLELKDGDIFYNRLMVKRHHYSICISGIKNMDEIKDICKNQIELHKIDRIIGDELDYTKNTTLEGEVISLIPKIMNFCIILIIYSLIILFLAVLCIATYENYTNLIIGFVGFISIFVIYYIYKLIF